MTSINALFHAFLWLCLSEYVSAAPLRFVYPYNSKSSYRSRKLVVFGDSFSDGGGTYFCAISRSVSAESVRSIWTEGAWVVSNNTWPADPVSYELLRNGRMPDFVLNCATFNRHITDTGSGRFYPVGSEIPTILTMKFNVAMDRSGLN